MSDDKDKQIAQLKLDIQVITRVASLAAANTTFHLDDLRAHLADYELAMRENDERDKRLVRAGWDAGIDAAIMAADFGDAHRVRKHKFVNQLINIIVKETA